MSSAVPEQEITRLEPRGPKGLKVRVHLDPPDPPAEDGAAPDDASPALLTVALEAVERLKLGVGDLLGPELRRKLLAADADVRVRDAALNLLSYRARTRTELFRKLRKKDFGTARVDRCLDRLEERGLLDDAEVAAAHVRDRLRLKPRGRAKLRSELRAKGVAAATADSVVDEVLDRADTDDRTLAARVAERWVERQSDDLLRALVERDDRDTHQKARRRLYGYLGRRGFRGGAISRGMDVARDEARRRLTGPGTEPDAG